MLSDRILINQFIGGGIILYPRSSCIVKASNGIFLVLGTFPDHRIGEEFIADYLLYILNKQRKFAWVYAKNLYKFI